MPEKDIFVNQAFLTVVESAANTLTFNKLETGISIHEKIAWLVARIDYTVGVSIANFAATNDLVNFGIATSDVFTTPALNQSAIVDMNTLTRLDIGTAASGFLMLQPIQKDFSNLPGGGILIPPNPIFAWVAGSALTTAITITARMFYITKTLKLEDFWELVELRRMVGT